MNIVIVLGRAFVHEKRVIEPACHHQARERAQPAQAALVVIFMQSGVPETGRRMPADRGAAVFAMGDVKGAVDQHLKDEAGTGAKLQAADAALDPVAQDRELHAGELQEIAGAPCQITTRMPLAVELNHERLPLTSFVMLSKTGCVQPAVE